MVLTEYLQRVDKTRLQQLSQGLGVPLVLLAIMGMVILPMPPILLDVLFSFNIALSLVWNPASARDGSYPLSSHVRPSQLKQVQDFESFNKC